MIFVVLSGLSGAAMGLSYRFRARLQLDPIWVLLFAAVFALGFSALGLAVTGTAPGGTGVMALGAGHGLTITLSMGLFFFVTDRARIGVSWTVVQLGVVIPFLFSIIFMGEVLEPAGIAAIACAVVAAVLFGRGRRLRQAKEKARVGDTAPAAGATDRRAGLIVRYAGVALVLSSVFTGGTQIFPRVYTELADGPGFPLLFWGSLFMIPYTIAVLVFRRRETRYKSLSRMPGRYLLFSFILSAFRFGLMAFLLVALNGVAGAVAFPVRSVVNTGTVVVVAAIFFSEHVSALEWVAIGLTVVSVAIIAAV